MAKKELPKKYLKLVGTKQTASGHLFSYSKSLEPKEYDVLDIRWGRATVMSIKEIREKGESSYEYPTFEILLKRPGMPRARWSKPFPISEINLKKKKRVATAIPQ